MEQLMTKMSTRRAMRRKSRKLAEMEAAKLTPAQAREKLAQWAAGGGDIRSLQNQKPLPPPPARRQEAPPVKPNRSPKLAPRGADSLTLADMKQ